MAGECGATPTRRSGVPDAYIRLEVCDPPTKLDADVAFVLVLFVYRLCTHVGVYLAPLITHCAVGGVIM